jgi:AcrR family transcriptional regulator
MEEVQISGIMKKSQSSNSRPYHHGDLRRAIVTAALELVRETQSVEFSIRELARRAGVSHNAPYKHFADKRDLLAAVSAEGFRLLATRMAAAPKRRSTPRARVSAMARGYVRQGIENPALYRLMFGGYLTGPEEDRPAIERAAAFNTRALLAVAIRDGALGQALPMTAHNERKIDGAILVYWSVLHGLTLLLVDRLVGPAEKAEELAESVWEGIVDGLTKRIPTLPADAWVGPRMSSKN